LSIKIQSHPCPPPIATYTPGEKTMLSSWLSRKIHGRRVSRAQFTAPPDEHSTIHEQYDAGIGRSLLLRIESRLPRWNSVHLHGDQQFARWGSSILRRQNCTLQFMPEHLFTIVWPSQGPGFMGPVAYYLVWLPIYDCFVVTASYPTRITVRYLDVAVGSFSKSDDHEKSVANIVYRDWRLQFHAWNIKHRAELWVGGAFGQEFVDQVADLAWTKDLKRSDGNSPIPQAPRISGVAKLPPTKRMHDACVLPFRRTGNCAGARNPQGDRP